jgi:hypothetical protein
MDEPRYLAVAVERRHPLFEASDEEHAAVHLEQVVGREGVVGWLGPVHGR